MAGAIDKPRALELRPDLRAAKIFFSLRGKGDDALLRAIMADLEAEGFTLMQAAELSGSLRCPEAVSYTHLDVYKRQPFDQPEAETEILEGPLLEYSGVLLAFFHMASALKMVVALALGVVLFFPGTISDLPAVNLIWFVVKCGLFMLFALSLIHIW